MQEEHRAACWDWCLGVCLGTDCIMGLWDCSTQGSCVSNGETGSSRFGMCPYAVPQKAGRAAGSGCDTGGTTCPPSPDIWRNTSNAGWCSFPLLYLPAHKAK